MKLGISSHFVSVEKQEHVAYETVRDQLLKAILPSHIFHSDYLDEGMFTAFINESLPLVKTDYDREKPSNISFKLLCPVRDNAIHFFQELTSKWLVPNKKLNILALFAIDFKFFPYDREQYTIAEIVLDISNSRDFEEVVRNLKAIETEVKLGVASEYQANRIMEFKGCSVDRKTALIQQKIGSLMQTRSKDYGKGIISQMQKFLVNCKDEFKSARDYHHISRIISILHLIRKTLMQKIEIIPDKRHVVLKFFKTKLFQNKIEQNVLGVMVGINLLSENEVFGKSHLTKAIKKIFPEIEAVDNSLFVDKNAKSNIQTVYLEIIKKNAQEFSQDEVNSLKEKLPLLLKNHIEKRVSSVFMPPNEEEIVKNITVLARQLNFVHDLPQVIVNFESQSKDELVFTVILLRLLKTKSLPLVEQFEKSLTILRFIPDRVKKVGNLRKKYIKEANVFRVGLSYKHYLRDDNAIDINKARADVISQLNLVLGEVRDYNGGMIFKQNEAYEELKYLLSDTTGENALLLEKFFYSIDPVEMTVVLSKEVLKSMFLMLVGSVKKVLEKKAKKRKSYFFKKEESAIFVIIPIYDPQKKKKLFNRLQSLPMISSSLVSFQVMHEDVHYQGYMFSSDDEDKQRNFLKMIQQALDF